MKSLKLKGSRESRKRLRATKVNGIVITVMRGETALLFDGDEKSQMRLLIRSQRMRATGQQAVRWTMADNTETDVTPDEMEEALDKAIGKQGELWPI